MPLDTSTYHLAHLRLDGRRWNELRSIHARISTQASADGSSYLEMGNTKVLCTVSGPAEVAGGPRIEGQARDHAQVVVEVGVCGFAGVDRRRKAGRGDRCVCASLSPLFECFFCDCAQCDWVERELC